MSRILVALSVIAALVCFGAAVQATKIRVGASASVPITDQINDVATRAVALVNQGIQDTNSQYSLVNVAEARSQVVAGVIYTLKLVLTTPISRSNEVCTISVFSQVWTNTFQIHTPLNCTGQSI